MMIVTSIQTNRKFKLFFTKETWLLVGETPRTLNQKIANSSRHIQYFSSRFSSTCVQIEWRKQILWVHVCVCAWKPRVVCMSLSLSEKLGHHPAVPWTILISLSLDHPLHPADCQIYRWVAPFFYRFQPPSGGPACIIFNGEPGYCLGDARRHRWHAVIQYFQSMNAFQSSPPYAFLPPPPARDSLAGSHLCGDWREMVFTGFNQLQRSQFANDGGTQLLTNWSGWTNRVLWSAFCTCARIILQSATVKGLPLFDDSSFKQVLVKIATREVSVAIAVRQWFCLCAKIAVIVQRQVESALLYM